MFPYSLEDKRCRNVEQGLHSRRIISNNIKTYAMLHAFAHVCLTLGEVSGQRNSLELRSTLLPLYKDKYINISFTLENIMNIPPQNVLK